MLAPARTNAAAAGEAVPRARDVPAEVWIVAAITIAGAVWRFSTLTAQSYWVDEATTVHEMTLSFGAMLHQVRIGETTPPLYFIVAWVWAKVFGTGEAGLRSLSALCGTLTIPVAYLCGRELVSKWAGAVAAALVAFSPFMLWYSQEARSYMLFGLLCALSLLFFARALRSPSNRNVAWWAVCSALAIGTHFFAGFLVAPEGLWLLFTYRRRAILIACAAVAVVQVAILPLAISDTSHPLDWIKQFPLSVRIEQIPVDLGLSSLYQSSIVTAGLWGAAVLAAILILLLVAGATREERRGAALAAALAACVILVPILLAEFGADYVVPRNFMPAFVPLAVLLGAAITARRTLPAGIALGAVVIGGFIWAQARIDGNPVYQRPDWAGVAAALGRPDGTRAIVTYAGGFAAQPLSIYLRGIPWGSTDFGQVSVDEVDVVANSFQSVARRLPPGVTLAGTRTVGTYLVARFRVAPAWTGPAQGIGVRAAALLSDGAPAPVLIQRAI